MKYNNPITSVSTLEMKLLLDKSFEDIKKNTDNFYNSTIFADNCKSVIGKIPKRDNFSSPQIIISEQNHNFFIDYDLESYNGILSKLEEINKFEEKSNLSQKFSKSFKNTFEWMIDKKLEIVNNLYELQESYLKTNDIFKLQPMSQQKMGDIVGLSKSMICRFIRDLTIKLPNDKVILTENLIPGQNLSKLKGIYILGELQNNSDLYFDGKWKIPDRTIADIFNNEYGMNIGRRTITKYKNNLK